MYMSVILHLVSSNAAPHPKAIQIYEQETVSIGEQA